MSEMEKEKVNCTTELEFINEVADDCILHMSDKNREYLINNPIVIEYHFSYCLYIRNNYIHNRDFSDVSFWVEPDRLSSKILRMIFSKLLLDYEYDNLFVENLYDDERFIKLRQEYKEMYGEYPVSIVQRYSQNISLETSYSISEYRGNGEFDYDKEMEVLDRSYKKCKTFINQLLEELAELVWQIDMIKKIAEECGITYRNISKKVEGFKKIFFDEGEYIPLQVCFLPYKKKIGHERYIEYRRILSNQLKKNPGLIEKLDKSYFKDRVLARTALKFGWTLKYLPMYKDDETMVKHSLFNDGTAIQYAAKRFQQDREWVKYAIEHSEDETIMYLNCMKAYRKDKELVYLACKVHRWNYVYVDKMYRDDFELAKICMEQIGDPNSVYSYLSKRLRANKELALLDLQEDFTHVEYYSAKLRNDDDIAAKLFELHGVNSWDWDYMSKRLRKKYGISDD